MVHVGITSGPWQLVYQKEGIPTRRTIALAANLMVTDSHLHLLEITTTVIQEIQPAHLFLITCTPLTLSGMAGSVKASVAVMGNLLHGSVWTYQTQLLMILWSAYVYLNQVITILSSSYLNSTFSTNEVEDNFSRT